MQTWASAATFPMGQMDMLPLYNPLAWASAGRKTDNLTSWKYGWHSNRQRKYKGVPSVSFTITKSTCTVVTSTRTAFIILLISICVTPDILGTIDTTI